MTTGTGLSAQWGIAAEATWGTPVTVTRFLEFNGETLRLDPTWLEPTGIRVGTKYKRSSRLRRSRRMVSGDVSLAFATRGMSLLVRHILGSPVSTPTQVAATTAYRHTHVPGDFRGLGLTMQVGRPEPSGTVRPHTFAGCKIPSWEFSCSDNEIPTLSVTVDGRDEATGTALATASFLAGSTVFDFSQASLLLGGTAATASGRTTITGGTAAATIIRSITFRGQAPMAAERFGLGNGGLKAEPLENDTPTITGSLEAEFSRTELYDLFANNTATALEFRLTGGAIGVSGENFRVALLMPSVRLKAAAPSVSGPDLVQMSTDFEAYSDETNPVIQVEITSDETTL